MYLDYSKINSMKKEQPMLRLRTLAGKELGSIPFVHNLSFKINYSELSEISFTVPYQVNGMLNPLYAAISSYKVVYTDSFGIYVLTSPRKEGDGMSETKTITGYSLEVLLRNKNLLLEEGTYNFWNPADPNETILGRILEIDPTWHVGYVAPRLIGCYRTFDEYDSTALDFCYGDAMDKYRCAFVFDVYDKSINVYDANEDTDTLPIYLNYKNLVDTISIDEVTDDMATKLYVYGSDGLTIREVNPTGTDYVVDLSYFLSNGDLDIKVGDSDIMLSDRVRMWQSDINKRQQYYTGLVASRASLSAQKIVAEADLSVLNDDLNTLIAQQSVIIQAISMETTESGKKTQQDNLDEINQKISQKESEISSQKEKISSLQADMDEYAAGIKNIADELSLSTYFTQEEQNVLNQYLIESTVEEETFVATDIDTSVSGVVSKVSGGISIIRSDITLVELEEFGKKLYTITGGSIVIENSEIDAEIVRGTIDAKQDNSLVLTAYLGSTKYKDKKFGSGLITISGTFSQFISDISAYTDDDITEYKGTMIECETDNADSYFTVNVNEFQRYSVESEMYDFGIDVLSDCAWPVYEFSINSANFLYQEKFEPFKNKLELGKSIYLELGSDGLLKPKIIGIQLDFEDISKFSLTFSNQYRLMNHIETFIGDVKAASRTSRSFDANKYIYNRAADKATQVDIFMNDLQNGAVDAVVSAKNQSVVLNGTGIHIGGDSKYQMRIIDNMIAMTDDGWKTAKLAIGRFATEETGEQWGVNAELIAGKLIIGKNIVVQNPLIDEDGNVTGIMMFQVDASGVWLYNSTFVLQNDSGGQMLISPKYGIAAGEDGIYTTSGTQVIPSFIDDDGDVILDSDGLPDGVNFYINPKDGTAYFRGSLVAKKGKIGGFTIEEDYLYTGSGGTYVALNGSGSNTHSAYAIWAGSNTPSSAKFWVKKNGEMKATNGTFSGTLNASKLNGTLSAAASGGWIEGCGIRVGANGGYTDSGYNFYVDENGNAELRGSLISDCSIYAPTIYADIFTVKPKSRAPGDVTQVGYSLWGYHGTNLMEVLNIGYFEGLSPYVVFKSPVTADADWRFGRTSFYGSIDFSNATSVTGLTATFG